MNTIVAQKMNNQIKALVSSAVFDVFNDPDFGLELSAKAKKRLSMTYKNNKTISLNQIKKKYL
ncbi:hypothetical protein A2643_02125 [Candidatus Nomurabacteria bacterium RIFCSPHIGHO2_01_FULL_39_220]|uniref:Uncharacterized protein n=1 Tax=Candidatus Nomurabacteria bacterium RIFCSPLOWO2_02_FULL_40_67 TaxID=1801787 RepID=A0A1F6Y4Z7_9BACT|nr:MAG: hypothetical protein UU01_C0010G0019 [Parcubacteria group bacterium GW2011_GWA2_40_37]KKS72420.1 MAG: hypothetical protein UV43_C0017G0020 [Parcubacteria group bacterium GW2011_GWF2_42_7]OGI63149.1 MAG: hypothetical protein A2W12_04235 [Candidatus Nomurabacteria bacterium RBG_16_40_11]OGI69895.1 MAG: hypothetical protein A2643_02125 [Candidatus Nomurabacteria bacterium RIFCSPHIGHO2_01_FULL_39_220]OGI72957.1 MAG: hypothetical protein A2W56_00630 [Candidatus Nomurabacteria bacterium RIFCS